MAPYPWSRSVKTGVRLRAKETEISAAQSALSLGKNFTLSIYNWIMTIAYGLCVLCVVELISEDDVISWLVGGVLYLGGNHLNTCSST